MDELIRHDNPEFTGLVDLGSCSIHTIHNAFGKGLEKCGKEIEQLCMDLHALFNSLLRTSHQLLVMQQLAVTLAATGPAHGTGTESHSLIIP